MGAIKLCQVMFGFTAFSLIGWVVRNSKLAFIIHDSYFLFLAAAIGISLFSSYASMIFIGYEFNLKWNFRYTKMVEIVQAIIVIILLASAATVYMVKVVTGGDVHLHKAKVNKESRVDSNHRPVYLFSVITQPLCQGIRRCTKREDIIQEQ